MQDVGVKSDVCMHEGSNEHRGLRPPAHRRHHSSVLSGLRSTAAVHRQMAPDHQLSGPWRWRAAWPTGQSESCRQSRKLQALLQDLRIAVRAPLLEDVPQIRLISILHLRTEGEQSLLALHSCHLVQGQLTSSGHQRPGNISQPHLHLICLCTVTLSM